MTAEQVALALAEEYGLPVFPCRPDKRPYTTHGLKDATGSIEQIATWWQAHPDALIGVPTGAASKLLVVDIDPAGEDWYRENFARLAAGRIHKTQRGHHLLYTMPDAPIRNSAGKLAPGVDVRAEGGYIIWWPAQGHETTGDPADIGPPPDWLIKQLTTAPERTAPTSNGNERIIEGGRNDAMTRLAGKMRRIGATQDEIESALIALNERCDPLLGAAELECIAGSISRYAATTTDENATLVYELIGDIRARIDQPYVAKNLIGANTLAVLYGESGSGKSHVALDIAMGIAKGSTTLNCKTTPGAVLYIAAEGAHGLHNRLAAARERGLIAPGAPLAIVNRAVQMDIESGDPQALVHAVTDLAAATGQKVQLIVIDTLARCLLGDENTAADMARFIHACDFIRRATVCAVLIVHHAGKDTSKGARGHSSLRAAVDTEILVEGRANPRTVTVTKQRDLPLIDAIGFELDPVTLGQDADGEPVTACVMRLTEAAPVRTEVRGKAQSTLMRALRETEREEPGKVWTIPDLRRTGRIAGVHRNSAISAVDSLIAARLLTPSVGGYRLA